MAWRREQNDGEIFIMPPDLRTLVDLLEHKGQEAAKSFVDSLPGERAAKLFIAMRAYEEDMTAQEMIAAFWKDKMQEQPFWGTTSN